MKTKVLHILSHLNTGGAETLVTNYALKIDKDKFDIIILTISANNNSINEEILRKNGIKVINLGDYLAFPHNTKNLFKKIVNKIHRHILLIKFVNKERPNIIHSHLHVTEFLLPINVKKLNIKLFYTVHTEVNVLFGKGRFKSRFCTNYCIKKKGMIPIALHENMRKDVNKFFNIDNTVVLHNGIDLERFNRSNYNELEILKTLNIKKESFIIGHVGRFSKEKNHKFILRVFREIIKVRPDAHLIFIGTGELEKSIKNDVRDLGLNNCVSFLGNRSDIPDLLSIMDVFLFPSLYEGTGIALIEAQAMGLKCVISDSIPKEAIITNKVKSLSLNSPIEEWCRCILENNKETGSIDLQKNRDSFKKYDMKTVIKKLEELYLKTTM